MNIMNEVAKLLGVELGETFKVHNYHGSYKLTPDGLMNISEGYLSNMLDDLLTGRYKITKIPFKPNFEQKYYYVGCDGNIYTVVWAGDNYDYYCYNANNCFRTSEEITEEDIEIIVREIKEKYRND